MCMIKSLRLYYTISAQIMKDISVRKKRSFFYTVSTCVYCQSSVHYKYNIFDSVSRMARDGDDGVKEYLDLYKRKVNLFFFVEPGINTEVYREACQMQIPRTGTEVDIILEAIEAYQVKLAEKQVRIAFQQAQKELDDLRQRTIEGLETARRSGKQLGRPRGRCITEKERKAKNIILKRDTLFGGDLCPSDCMKVIGISRGTYYKYRNDLSKFPIA